MTPVPSSTLLTWLWFSLRCLKHQLLVIRRPRPRAPNLSALDRVLLGFWSLFLSPRRIQRVARRKIADLMDTMTVAKEVSERGAARAAIVDVALRHHLVSRFTSLVAVDVTPSAPSGTTALTKPVPTELPAGWSRQHVVGSLPQGATAAELLMLLGFLALTAGLLIFWSGDKSCKEKRSVFSSSQ